MAKTEPVAHQRECMERDLRDGPTANDSPVDFECDLSRRVTATWRVEIHRDRDVALGNRGL